MSETMEQPAEAEAADDVRDLLERRLEVLQAEMRERVVRAEMKAHAVRAGMVDLDGLKLLDTSGLALDERGEVPGAEALMAEMRRAKPWLFRGVASSSSVAAAPPAQAPRARLATEMDEAEWRAARADLLRRG